MENNYDYIVELANKTQEERDELWHLREQEVDKIEKLEIQKNVIENDLKKFPLILEFPLVTIFIAIIFYLLNLGFEQKVKDSIPTKKIIVLFEKPDNKSKAISIDTTYSPKFEIIDSTKYYYKVNYVKSNKTVTGFLNKSLVNNKFLKEDDPYSLKYNSR